jgi:hypothetical protein
MQGRAGYCKKPSLFKLVAKVEERRPRSLAIGSIEHQFSVMICKYTKIQEPILGSRQHD